MLLETSFQTHEGWTYRPPADQPGTGRWIAPDTALHGILAAESGAWISPPLQLTPYRIYQVTFSLETPSPTLWAAKHEYADGTLLLSDHYSVAGPLDGSTPYSCCFRVAPGAVATRLYLEPHGEPIRLAGCSLRPVVPDEVVGWLDGLAAALPPIEWRPPADRWQRLSRTRHRLAAGGRLRVVMLGDSIVNDIANSCFEATLAGTWPGAAWEVVSSVRGSTGGEYYREPEQFEAYVSRFQPDLLIVGGRSNRLAGSIGEVVQRARRVLPCDIVLMTDGFPRLGPAARPAKPPAVPHQTRDEFRRELAGIADAHQCAWFDLQTAVEDYLAATGIAQERLMRDPVHANDYGRALYARLLTQWFAAR